MQILSANETKKTKKRVFVISRSKFPRGDAAANYIQYFSLALMEAGYEVVVIGKGAVSGVKTGETNCGISYILFDEKNANSLGSSDQIKPILVFYHASQDDLYVFYYSDYFLMNYCAKKYSSKNVFFIRVEDMQPYQYKINFLTPRYLYYRLGVEFAWKRLSGIFSISSRLVMQDRKHGCDSMRLPIMADTHEFCWMPDKCSSGTISFIYPGMKVNGYEDDFEAMFSALGQLSDLEKKKITVHITGTSKEKIQGYIDEQIWKEVEDTLVIHGYISYDELVEIYLNSDFLLLPRKINNITKANFPSKIPELMSFGIIPVCTDVGDYTKIYLNDTNAIIMSETGVDACLQGIRKAIKMSARERAEMRNNARKLAEDEFDFRHWSKKIDAFLNKKSAE